MNYDRRSLGFNNSPYAVEACETQFRRASSRAWPYSGQEAVQEEEGKARQKQRKVGE